MCIRDRGKDVFAVPFGIYDRNGAGTLGLIRDGAIPAISAQDVAYPFAQRLSRQIALEAQKETAKVQKIEEKTIQEKEKTVHDVHPFQREDEHAAHTLPKTERIYPVSYTHLDVYKRQLSECVAKGQSLYGGGCQAEYLSVPSGDAGDLY